MHSSIRSILLNIFITIMILAAIAIGCFIFYLATQPNEQVDEWVIVNLSAKKTIYLYEPHQATFWDWEVPEDGTIIEQKEEIHHYENGKAIYATKYFYSVNRWFFTRALTQSLTNGDKVWPPVDKYENEYIKKEETTYSASVKNPQGKVKTYKITEEEWLTFKIDDKVKIQDKTIVLLSPRPMATASPTETHIHTFPPFATANPTTTLMPKPSLTPSPTPKPTNTPKPTATPSPRPTTTPKPTATPTPKPTETPEPTPTDIPTPIPTDIPISTPSPEPTESPVPSDTPTPTVTPTAAPEPTDSPTEAPTEPPAETIIPTDNP